MSVGFEIDTNVFSDLPGNFIIRESVPQQKLLEHVDVFITHAGMNSVNEAICLGVPMIMLPHTIEQNMIARRVNELGIGTIININKFTPEELYKNVNKLISDSVYKEKALKYKSIFSDEEKRSHIEAADSILNYIEKQPQLK